MAGLNHQACGNLDLESAARCPDRALLSKHSNQNEKPDLGQESDAHDRDRKEHVARRERVHECLALSCEAPRVNHSGSKMFRFQTQTARDASCAGIGGGLRRSPPPESEASPAMSAVPLNRGHRQFEPSGPKSAIFGLMRRSKRHLYSITLSACPGSEGGTARPSALAVLRLTIGSNFVGACTHLGLPYESHRLRAPDRKGSTSEVPQ